VSHIPAACCDARRDAVTSARETGAWLRERRQARGWPVPEMARRLRRAARDNGDSTVPGNEATCRNIRRWESGAGGVSERYRLHYSKALGLAPGQFGAGRPQETAGEPAPAPPPGGYPGDEMAARMEQLAVRLCAAAAECAEAAAALAQELAGRPVAAGARLRAGQNGAPGGQS
jgi:transcriptional regulator with XRE-family HTH domain